MDKNKRIIFADSRWIHVEIFYIIKSKLRQNHTFCKVYLCEFFRWTCHCTEEYVIMIIKSLGFEKYGTCHLIKVAENRINGYKKKPLKCTSWQSDVELEI